MIWLNIVFWLLIVANLLISLATWLRDRQTRRALVHLQAIERRAHELAETGGGAHDSGAGLFDLALSQDVSKRAAAYILTGTWQE